MKLLGINGSPRTGGNTEILLDRALFGAKNKGAKTEHLVLNNLKFSPCQECAQIDKNKGCKVIDDMQDVYKKINRSDAIILASPIFFGSLSAQTKMMIDRFQCFWMAKYVFKKDLFSKRKIGAFISVEASNRKDFFTNAKSIVKNLFATIDIEYKFELLCSGVDKKAGILRYPALLDKAFNLGQKIVLEKI
ncbi:MAG: flavodoxin family protein [Candidatus Omnitrophota bacterium]